MDKGIRPWARQRFQELNELRRRNEAPYVGPKANTIFRKQVIGELMEQFGISLASASTHYNDAFRFLKELNADLVSGLGRPEDKKGGRKKKVQGPVELAPPEDYVDAESVVQETWTLKRKSDGAVVQEGLTLEAARDAVQAARRAKKAALYFV